MERALRSGHREALPLQTSSQASDPAWAGEGQGGKRNSPVKARTARLAGSKHTLVLPFCSHSSYYVL